MPYRPLKICSLYVFSAAATADLGRNIHRKSALDLEVPFSEKDDAKRLGARWNPQRRTWYVPPGVDPRPFARWRPGEPEVQPYQVLSRETYLVTAAEECWRCKQAFQAVACLMAPGFVLNEQPNGSRGERNADWAFAEYITRLPPDAIGFIQSVQPAYRQGFSRTTDSRYWANHCPSCRALQGDFHLYSEPDGAFWLVRPWTLHVCKPGGSPAIFSPTRISPSARTSRGGFLESASELSHKVGRKRPPPAAATSLRPGVPMAVWLKSLEGGRCAIERQSFRATGGQSCTHASEQTKNWTISPRPANMSTCANLARLLMAGAQISIRVGDPHGRARRRPVLL